MLFASMWDAHRSPWSGYGSGSGLYRSTDGGAAWQDRNGDLRLSGRAWYFSRITIDPEKPETFYIPNTALYRSRDGGRTIEIVRSEARAVDQQLHVFEGNKMIDEDIRRQIVKIEEEIEQVLDGAGSGEGPDGLTQAVEALSADLSTVEAGERAPTEQAVEMYSQASQAANTTMAQ